MSVSRRWIWFFVGTPVVFVLLILVGFWQARAYLHSDGFRKLLGEKVSEHIKAEGQFAPLSWTDSSFYSEKYTARGKVGARFQEIDADQIRADVNLRGVWEKKWRVDSVQIERLGVKIGPGTIPEISVSKPEKTADAPKPAGKPGWLPNRVELRKVTVASLDLDGSNSEKFPFTANGIHVTAEPDGSAWKLTTSGGKIQREHGPALDLNGSELRYADGTLFITSARATSATGGNLSANGQIDFDNSQNTRLSWKFDALPAESVLPRDWRARLHGKFYGNLDVTSSPATASSRHDTVATGHVELKEGRLDALPVLEQIAVFTRTQRFRQLSLDQVRGDVRWENGTLTVTNFNAESAGLVRLTGSFSVTNGQINGNLEIGLTPGSLRWIPGSQESVFTVSRDGYLWTHMKVTGPVDHPEEDLSERLAIAAGQNLLKRIDQDSDKLKDSLKDAAGALIDLLGK
ncbi:MAG TPA: hypothetical protein VIT91_09195 [Chthoniobacterales bacterium]